MRGTCTPRPNTYLVNTETLVTANTKSEEVAAEEKIHKLQRDLQHSERLRENTGVRYQALLDEFGQLEQENKKLKKFETEFGNVSTDLYFMLRELNEYVNGQAPYNMHKAALNTSLILKTKDFLIRRLTSACDRLQVSPDYMAVYMSTVRKDLEKELNTSQ
jgi:hypothetical protein